MDHKFKVGDKVRRKYKQDDWGTISGISPVRSDQPLRYAVQFFPNGEALIRESYLEMEGGKEEQDKPEKVIIRPHIIITDRFTLPEGSAVLQCPERLSRESYEDLVAWLQIVLRKAKRSIDEFDFVGSRRMM